MRPNRWARWPVCMQPIFKTSGNPVWVLAERIMMLSKFKTLQNCSNKKLIFKIHIVVSGMTPAIYPALLQDAQLDLQASKAHQRNINRKAYINSTLVYNIV